MQFGVKKHVNFSKTTKLHSCYNFALVLHEKWTRFQPIRRTKFFHAYYYTQIEWNFGSSYRRLHTDPANSNRKGKWEVCKHAKRQKVEKALDYVSYSPYISFVLQLLAAALQQNKASLFVNVVVLGLIEANFHHFTSYLHSAVVLRNETHQIVR